MFRRKAGRLVPGIIVVVGNLTKAGLAVHCAGIVFMVLGYLAGDNLLGAFFVVCFVIGIALIMADGSRRQP